MLCTGTTYFSLLPFHPFLFKTGTLPSLPGQSPFGCLICLSSPPGAPQTSVMTVLTRLISLENSYWDLFSVLGFSSLKNSPFSGLQLNSMSDLTQVRSPCSYVKASINPRLFVPSERIADQKVAVRTLVVLYRNSVSHRSDTLENEHKASEVFRKIKQHVRLATTTTATVFGNVASEIAGSSVLQPNSPQAIVKTALESANKSRVVCFWFPFFIGQVLIEWFSLLDGFSIPLHSLAQTSCYSKILSEFLRHTKKPWLLFRCLIETTMVMCPKRNWNRHACMSLTLIASFGRHSHGILKGISTANNFRLRTPCRTWTALLEDWTIFSCRFMLLLLLSSLPLFWCVTFF